MVDETVNNGVHFRRVMTAACAATLLLLTTILYLYEHFDGVPISVRMRLWPLAGMAALELVPIAAVFALLARACESRTARAVGWTLLVPAVAAWVAVARYPVGSLRPAIFYGNYDAAAIESVAVFRALNQNTDWNDAEFKSLFAQWKQHPTNRDEIEDIRRRVLPLIESDRKALAGIRGLKQAMAQPFDARGVGAARRDEFLRLSYGPLDFDKFERTYTTSLFNYQTFEQRLSLLIAHSGQWRWQSDGSLKFDDPAIGDEYSRLKYTVNAVQP